MKMYSGEVTRIQRPYSQKLKKISTMRNATVVVNQASNWWVGANKLESLSKTIAFKISRVQIASRYNGNTNLEKVGFRQNVTLHKILRKITSNIAVNN